MTERKGCSVDAPVRESSPDATSSPVALVRMDPTQAYIGVPELLKSVIDESSTEAWERTRHKIDYIYASLDYALGALEKETGFIETIVSEVRKGKKLLFKPNLVSPSNIDPIDFLKLLVAGADELPGSHDRYRVDLS